MKKGCQIDLIIECLDKRLLICECKWSRKKIGLDALESLMAKIALYPNPDNYTIRPVLIAAAGVTKPVRETKGLLVIQLDDLF
jgi:hypothetical protein